MSFIDWIPPVLFASGGEGVQAVALLVLQIAFILAAAKIVGEITERYLKQPSVLGELVAGMIIGPYALGGISIGSIGPLFPVHGTIPVSDSLYALSEIAAIILLFMAGLETNLQQFFKYGLPATAIAIGGVIFPFAFGASLTAIWGITDAWTHPVALFMGSIMVATSVGITARILSDIGKLATPEGVTIIASAVVDDVLGILILAIVISIASSGTISAASLAIITVKAVGFWLVLTTVGILSSKKIAAMLRWFNTPGAAMCMALSLCFICAAMAQYFGLAMIIGAYVAGLALSSTQIAHHLNESLEPVYNFLVPIFFVVMGMMVNFKAMIPMLWFGIMISILAIISKVAGCGLPAMAVGFNKIGAFRIGIGMLPRGEVALIVASLGISHAIIPQDIYGVAVMMTFVTTLMTPIILVPLFLSGGSGTKEKSEIV